MLPEIHAVSYAWHDDHYDVTLLVGLGVVVMAKQGTIDGPVDVNLESTLAVNGAMPRSAEAERWLSMRGDFEQGPEIGGYL